MSEPTLICSAPEIANSAQKIALYSHYAAAVAGFLGGGVMLMRSREQEKVPHVLGAIAAFGVGIAALYSQWEFNQFLYQHRELATCSVAVRAGLWVVWSVLLLTALNLTPGFRFKKLKKAAFPLLIAFSVLSFAAGAVGEGLAAAEITLRPPAEIVEVAQKFKEFTAAQPVAARLFALALGLPAAVLGLLTAGTFVFSQAKKVEKRSEENHQLRTSVMTMVAVCVPAVVYGAASFLVAKGGQGLDQAVLLFNCADVIAMFFVISATMSLLGVPANFPKPPKPPKPPKAPKRKKAEAEPAAPAGDAAGPQPTVFDQQQAYAQAYAQQLLAQQQAYAQYYAQQQAAAAQQQQTPPPAATGAVPAEGASANAAPAPSATDPAAAAELYRRQQAQYYAQQQAYAAYQQQQQAYQQAYAAQQQYAQPQQQVYAQAYAQQQAAYRNQQQPVAPTATVPVAAPAAHGVKKVAAVKPVAGVKKVGNVRQIKKIR